MDAQLTVEVSSEVLIQRIDAIMRELQELRRLVSSQPRLQETPADIVSQLAGCLGQGSWDEYEDDIELERFAS
jgi:hypothetical protein